MNARALQQRVADDLVELLRPACERIEVTGGLRRADDASRLGVLKVLVVPRLVPRPLAAEGTPPAIDTLIERVHNLDAAGLLDKLDEGRWVFMSASCISAVLTLHYQGETFRVYEVDSVEHVAAAQFALTGTRAWLRAMAHHADAIGWNSSDLIARATLRAPDGTVRSLGTEAAIFTALGLQYQHPASRLGRVYPLVQTSKK